MPQRSCENYSGFPISERSLRILAEISLALPITWASTDIWTVVSQPWPWDALTLGCFLQRSVFTCPWLTSLLHILYFGCCVKCYCFTNCLFLWCRSLMDYLCMFYILKHWWIHWVVLVFLFINGIHFNKWNFTLFKILLSENIHGLPDLFGSGCLFFLYLCNCSGYHPTLQW